MSESPLRVIGHNENLDSRFFYDWSQKIAAGDWLGRESNHPYHSWHDQSAKQYFEKHPEAEAAILAAHPERDSTFQAGRVLWDELYGGLTFHQEPLYPYLLAMLTTFSTDPENVMFVLQSILGVLSGFLLMFFVQRHFGYLAALIVGLSYLFCSVITFYDIILLRVTWITFFTLLLVNLMDWVLKKPDIKRFALLGFVAVLAYLLKTTFILYSVLFLLYFAWQNRQNLKQIAKPIAGFALAFLIGFSPVIIRNAKVGVPLTKIESVGAVTAFACLNPKFTSVNTWNVEYERVVEVLKDTDGKLLPTVFVAIGGYDSVGAFFGRIYEKFQCAVKGKEYASNENYYFFKENIPILSALPVDGYWIMPFGLAGLLLLLFRRKFIPGFSIALFVTIGILLGFYVVGRFRVQLLVLLLPLCGYFITEILFKTRDWRWLLGSLVVFALIFYKISIKPYRHSWPRALELKTLYSQYYEPKLREMSADPSWEEELQMHTEYMKYEPAYIRSLKSNSGLVYPKDIETVKALLFHYKLHAQLLDLTGQKEESDRYSKRVKEFEQILKNSGQ